MMSSQQRPPWPASAQEPRLVKPDAHELWTLNFYVQRNIRLLGDGDPQHVFVRERERRPTATMPCSDVQYNKQHSGINTYLL